MNRSDDSVPQSSTSVRDSECAWVRDHAPVHALRALDPTDADRLEEHLLLCQLCDREFSELARASSLLGAAVPLVDPPASLKRNLMIAIRAEKTLVDTKLLQPKSPELPSAPPPPVPVPRRTWPSGRYLFAPMLGALLLLGLWTLNTHQSLDSQRSEVVRLERENEALTVHIGSIQAGQRAFGSSGTWYPLNTVNGTSGEAGGIVMSGSQSTTTLLSVWNMPEEHDSYHIVCESIRGELLAAGEIQVNEHGNGTVTLTLPAPVTEYRAVHVLPNDAATAGVEDVTHDILQLLMGEPTAIATGES